MSDNDPFITAARQLFEASVREVRGSIEGLDAKGLNWKPEAPETNSVAILASHALGSCRDWLCIALGAPRPPRSRADEFLSEFESEERALAFVEAVSADTLRILRDAQPPDWSSMVSIPEQPGDPDPTAAYAVIHAIEHLREHVAHLQLTRQLWDARSRSASG